MAASPEVFQVQGETKQETLAATASTKVLAEPTHEAGATAPRPFVNGWIPFPTSVCSYFKKGTCLRIGCSFFHGTEAVMHEHQARGATLYRVNDGAIHFGPVPSAAGDNVDDKTIEINHDHLSDSDVGNSEAPPLATLRAGTEANNTVRLQDLHRNVVACLSYLSGNCSRHDCHFVHLRSDIRLLPTSVCAYHRTPMGCQKGVSCRYFHGLATELTAMKERGVVMYNPFTNKAYESLPEQLEDPQSRKPPVLSAQRPIQQYHRPQPQHHHYPHQVMYTEPWTIPGGQAQLQRQFFMPPPPQPHQQFFQLPSAVQQQPQYVVLQLPQQQQLSVLFEAPQQQQQYFIVQPNVAGLGESATDVQFILG